MRRLLTAIATAGVLMAGPAAAVDNLNPDLEEICKPLLELNTEFGASAAPGSPIGGQMQNELSYQQPSTAPSGRCSSSRRPLGKL